MTNNTRERRLERLEQVREPDAEHDPWIAIEAGETAEQAEARWRTTHPAPVGHYILLPRKKP